MHKGLDGTTKCPAALMRDIRKFLDKHGSEWAKIATDRVALNLFNMYQQCAHNMIAEKRRVGNGYIGAPLTEAEIEEILRIESMLPEYYMGLMDEATE